MATAFGMVRRGTRTGSTFSFAGSVGVSFAGDIVKKRERITKCRFTIRSIWRYCTKHILVMYELGGSVEDGSPKFIDIMEGMEQSSKTHLDILDLR